jgi:hypothetical protein
MYSTLCLLHGIWRQLWCIGTSSPSKTTTLNQTHQCLLPSLSWTCQKGPYQDFSKWYQESDSWCTYQGSHTKWLYLSSQVHVRQVTSPRYQCEGVLRINTLCTIAH